MARDVASYIAKTVAGSGKPVSLPWIASKLPAEVKGLDAADWAGFTNFRALVDSLKLDPLVVKWDAGLVLDPARHAGPERNAGPSNSEAQAANGLAAWPRARRSSTRVPEIKLGLCRASDTSGVRWAMAEDMLSRRGREADSAYRVR